MDRWLVGNTCTKIRWTDDWWKPYIFKSYTVSDNFSPKLTVCSVTVLKLLALPIILLLNVLFTCDSLFLGVFPLSGCDNRLFIILPIILISWYFSSLLTGIQILHSHCLQCKYLLQNNTSTVKIYTLKLDKCIALRQIPFQEKNAVSINSVQFRTVSFIIVLIKMEQSKIFRTWAFHHTACYCVQWSHSHDCVCV